MARKRVRDAEGSRQAILKAAREVLGREGFHGASVEKIAGRAGVAKGTVFLHFKSKEGLLVALIDQHFAACERIYTQVTPPGTSAREQLEGIGSVANWSSAEINEFGQVLMSIWGGLPPTVRRRLERLMRKSYKLYLTRVAALFRELLGAPSVEGVSVESLAAAYLAALDGLVVREHVVANARPAAREVSRALRFVLVDNLADRAGGGRKNS